MIAFISNNYASFSLFLFVKMYDIPVFESAFRKRFQKRGFYKAF